MHLGGTLSLPGKIDILHSEFFNMHHSVFQVLAVHPNGEMEAGTAWFSADAQEYARKRYPKLAEDSLYGLTNAHVVNGASTLFSRHVVCRRLDLPLSVCGVAGDVDLAVVRLSGSAKELLESKLREKTGLTRVPMLQMKDSDDVVMPAKYDPMSPNASVLAVGHPLGSEFQTQTKGVCEGFKRVDGMGASNLYIAHTATIQPGNSGGPLLHKNGLVVGINSMKATGQATDNLNMAIPSRRIMSYLPHMLDERQHELSAAVVQLANIASVQGMETRLLDAVAQQSAVLGDARAMQNAYAAAMSCGGNDCSAAHNTDAKMYPTLTSFIRGFSHKPGFHKLFSKVSELLHNGDAEKLHRLACAPGGFDAKLCGHCKKRALTDDQDLYCVSAVPSKLVHSPTLGFDYKASSRLTRQALGVSHLNGGVVVSEVLPYGALSSRLMKYDVISEVHTQDGAMKLDGQGEHYRGDWGLSLGLADLVDRAPLSTKVAFKVHRDGNEFMMDFVHSPLTADQRPAVRCLDASEAHMNAAVTVAGVTFKVLRMSDLADPRIAQSGAAQYAAPLKRHMEKVIVAQVDPGSAVFHDYSLMPGQVVSHVDQRAIKTGATGGAWRDFISKLSGNEGRGGLAMLSTEQGGIDTLPVSQPEAAQLLRYLQSSATLKDTI